MTRGWGDLGTRVSRGAAVNIRRPSHSEQGHLVARRFKLVCTPESKPRNLAGRPPSAPTARLGFPSEVPDHLARRLWGALLSRAVVSWTRNRTTPRVVRNN